MSKSNKDFFKEKKVWSTIKDDLLGCYLTPYFAKILSMGNPVLYVDCFAGKGKFDDGKLGSPLIALESLKTSNYHSNAKVNMKFIELNHAKELEKNIPFDCRDICEVIDGKFEDNIINILDEALTLNKKTNVFLYIDPYGIKALNANLFDSLINSFETAELLINFNSFGFIREACRAKKILFRENEDEIFKDLEEYDSSVLNSIYEIDEIAGGSYWQKIIDDYNQGIIDCYQAEKRLSNEYKNRLRNKYKYVLDMPIRIKSGNHPKYRMVFATNHHDGCMLMGENIAKRTDELIIDIQNYGQLSLFNETADNELIDDEILTENVKSMLNKISGFIRLNKFIADFYNEYGVLCGVPHLTSGKDSVLKTLEKNNYIEVKRNPSTTSNGKISAFWQEKSNQSVEIRKK